MKSPSGTWIDLGVEHPPAIVRAAVGRVRFDDRLVGPGPGSRRPGARGGGDRRAPTRERRVGDGDVEDVRPRRGVVLDLGCPEPGIGGCPGGSLGECLAHVGPVHEVRRPQLRDHAEGEAGVGSVLVVERIHRAVEVPVALVLLTLDDGRVGAALHQSVARDLELQRVRVRARVRCRHGRDTGQRDEQGGKRRDQGAGTRGAAGHGSGGHRGSSGRPRRGTCGKPAQ